MQGKIGYIIGAGILLIAGVFIYSLSKDTTIVDNYSNNNQNNTNQPIQSTTTNTTQNNNMEKEIYTAKIQTNKGEITLELNAKIAPNTVANFKKLADSGFYNGVKFHRVIKDFMIQAGDPQSKDDSKVELWGTGGPGYKFADEITDQATYQKGYVRGTLAMANSCPNTNGSQFFIMHKDMALPPLYTIFGRVTSGIEVVDAIAQSKTGINDRPVDAITITSVTVN